MRTTILIPLAALLLVWGCKKKNPIETYDPPEGSYGLIYEKVFLTSCALSACHNGDPGTPHPKLMGENAYKEVFNGHVHNSQAIAADLLLVQPSNPDSSFLYQKMIFDSSAFAFGSAMPAGGLTLSSGAIEFVREWIAAGAPLDGHVADRNLID